MVIIMRAHPRAAARSRRLHDPKPIRPTTSAAAQWAPLARFVEGEARLGRWAAQRPGTSFIYQVIRFGVEQGWGCLFRGPMVALILGTALGDPARAFLARYD